MRQNPGAAGPNQSPSISLADYVEKGLADFEATGEPYVCHLPRGESIDEYAALLGLHDLEGTTIVRTYYANPVSGDYGRYGDERHRVDYPITVGQLLQNIASSYGGMCDFPNDFMVGMAVQVAEDRCISFGLESEEVVGICGDCNHAGYDESEYGCGHIPDEYNNDYWLIVSNLGDVNEIDWDRGELH